MLFKQISLTKNKDFTCLSENEIKHIQAKAKNSSTSFAESIRLSSENMAGDLQSQIRGTGIDFEENKPYQTGSDSRHINWRTFARTRQLYVNIYNEDKRPSTYLVLDQRSNMYFGTRKQLKIKQALKFAIYSILRAMHQQQTVSGVQIVSKPKWHTSYSSSSSILSFIDSLNTAYDISDTDITEPTLNDILNKLKLNDGAELIIISDLHDMNKQTISSLYTLSRRYKVSILQIQDPVEINLPTKGIFNIQNDSQPDMIELNCNNKNITTTYQQQISERFNNFKMQCTNMGVNFFRYSTIDDVF